jgi:alpha-glucosidase
MMMQADGAGNLYARLAPSAPVTFGFRSRYAKDEERLSKPAAVTGAITTPWRIVMIGPDLNALVNCDIVHNVSPPPDPKLFPKGINTDWVKPGRAIWSYLDGGSNTIEGMKEWANLAKELGFEYNVLENFWRSWPESQLKELADYSRERGVQLILWSSRASVQDPKLLEAWFALCNRVGAAGVKIDFFDHEHREVIDLYEMMAKAGAEHKLLVDFHGTNKPTGLERTYPNVVGYEGIRGMEFPPPYAQLDVTFPFTRLLAGLADHTPVHFGSRLGDTTWAHQVANAVILQAPLLVYSANPANMLANPSADMLKSIPSVWDETVVLPVSEIRETAAFARRKGNTWFLAISNGPAARTIRVDLASFLGRATGGRRGSYQSMLIRDTGEAAAVKVENLTLSATDSLNIDLRSGGGFVGRFRN